MNKINHSIVKYTGSKWRMAPWIISFFPKHKIYVEPFGGAANVLLRKIPSRKEVYNDLYSEIYNLFYVLRNYPKELIRLCTRTPYSYQQFKKRFIYFKSKNRILRAWVFIYASFFGVGGVPRSFRKTGFMGNFRNSSPELGWDNIPENLSKVAIRFKKVLIHKKEYKWCLKYYDGKNTLFYLDPPYVLSTRKSAKYKHEMKNKSHIEMLKLINNLQGYVVISGYESKLYEKYLEKKFGWHKFTRNSINMAKNKRIECVWLSPRTYKIYKKSHKSLKDESLWVRHE